MSRQLTETDYQNAANRLGVPLASVKAVATVESAGSGFLADGRVKIQYEPHVMYKRLQIKFGNERADRELVKHPDLVALKAGSYNSADREDKDMEKASEQIDRQCALESASWGAFQIMGYHWALIGFESLQAFVNAQYKAAGQLDSFVRFILADKRLIRALKSKDWGTFAAIYNGPAYKKYQYDIKMADAYKRYGGV